MDNQEESYVVCFHYKTFWHFALVSVLFIIDVVVFVLLVDLEVSQKMGGNLVEM
jgi:hypothetical protein